MSMKILFINTLYSPYIGGGAEITLKSLIEGFKTKGHNVSVLSTGPKPGLNEDEVDGIRVYRVGVRNLYWHHRTDKPHSWLRALWHLRDSYNPAMGRIVERLVKDIKPDLVNCHNIVGFSSSVWPAISRAGVPISQVLHDLYNLCPTSNMFCHGRSCVRQCIRCKLFRIPHVKLSKKVSCVIGVSQFILQRHLDYGLFSGSAIKIAIHNARSIKRCKHRGPVANDRTLTFGFIGSLVPAKGVELLLQAFNAIDIIKGSRLLIAGVGPEPYQSQLKLYQTEQISFLGYTNPEDFFPKIDVLVVPSIWNDTLPGVVVESLANSVPVIGSCLGGIPEMITNGENGFLFDPNNPSDLRKILNKLIEAPEQVENMRALVSLSAEQFIDTNRWINMYEKVFVDLIGTSLLIQK